MTVLLLVRGGRLVADPSVKNAWRLFHTSNLYLLVILLAACIAAIVQLSWPF
jgi:heme O synthase-like polyprenyltransferase